MPRESAEHLFICLLLSDTTVQSALFGLSGAHGVEIVRQSSMLQYKDAQEAVVKVDQALQDLGKSSEKVNDVIFALPQNWVTPEGINDDRKPLLKNVTEDLGLQPIGFVVVGEVIQQLFVQEAAPSQLVLLISDRHLSVSHYHQAELQSTESVGISKDIVADAQEAFARLRRSHTELSKYLPSRVLVTSLTNDENEVNEAQQALLAVDWKASGLFLDQPLINVVPPDKLLFSIVVQAAKAVAQVKGIKTPPIKEPPVPSVVDTTEPVQDGELETAVATSFGVPVKSAPLPDVTTTTLTDPRQLALEGELVDEGDADEPKRSFFKLPRLSLGGKRMPFMIGGFVAGMVVLLFIAFFGIQSMAKAQVSVTLKAQTIADEAEITLDPDATSSNPEERILKANLVTKKVLGDKSIETTGVKLVGEKAKGIVTLFNKTDSTKTFSKGTVLTSGKLKFSLEEEVTVASATASVNNNGDGETKTYGKSDVTVMAADIGTDYNLAKNTELQVADFSSSTYLASVTDGLTGGSSREIRVVSAEDRKKVLSELEQDLVKKAEKEFSESSSNGTFQLPTGQKKVIDTEYSAKEGDETKSLSLALEIEFQGVAYNVEDLKPLAQEILKDKIPSGFALTDEPPTILSQPETASGSAEVVLDANITAKAKSQMTAEMIKEAIKGKPVSEAVTILKGNPEIAEADIKLQPSFAKFIVTRIPAKLSTITVEIK